MIPAVDAALRLGSLWFGLGFSVQASWLFRSGFIRAYVDAAFQSNYRFIRHTPNNRPSCTLRKRAELVALEARKTKYGIRYKYCRWRTPSREQDRKCKSSYLLSILMETVYAADCIAICLMPSYKSFVTLASIPATPNLTYNTCA